MNMTRMSIDVPKELHRAIKIQASFHDETIRDYVVEAIVKKLDEDKKLSKETEQTLSDSDRGKNLNHYKKLDDLYKNLGI